MTEQTPPLKNAEHTFYIGLPSIASSGAFQSNPTLAAGDFKVSIDGGALANLATLPTVTPSGGKMVELVLSAAEMNGDNITIVASDSAGSEWGDVIVNIQTTSGNFGDVAGIKAKTDQLEFTKTNELDVNIQSVNDTTVTGDGQTGTEWGP